MAVVSWTWQSRPAKGLHDLVEAFYCGLPQFSYSMSEQTRFKTVLARGEELSFLEALVGGEYFYGDLKTLLTITHRPNAAGFVEWSFRYDVELRQDDDMPHVEELGSEETVAFIAYYSRFAEITDRFLPE